MCQRRHGAELIRRRVLAGEGRTDDSAHTSRRIRYRLDHRIERTAPAKAIGDIAGERAHQLGDLGSVGAREIALYGQDRRCFEHKFISQSEFAGQIFGQREQFHIRSAPPDERQPEGAIIEAGQRQRYLRQTGQAGGT